MTTTTIHPTAIIAESAEIGPGTEIGPYAIIGKHSRIGKNCRIHAHAIIEPLVTMGDHNEIFPHAVIGGLPQDLSFDPAIPTGVTIGDHNTFREGVTVSRASFENQSTLIGSHCYLMNNAHIAHDCTVGDANIFASSATLGGHVQVGDKVFFGGGAMVHQFCRIGSFAMIAGVLGIRKDVIPYTLIGGTPVRHYRLNTIGLRRAGITGQRYKTLNQAFRRLKANQSLDGVSDTIEVSHLREWLTSESKRGIYAFIDKAKTRDQE